MGPTPNMGLTTDRLMTAAVEDDQNNGGEWSRDILEDTAEAVDRLLKVLPSNEECKGIWHWYQDRKKRGEDFNPKLQFGIAERFCLSAHEIVGSSTRLASKLRATRFKLEFDIVQDLVKDKVSECRHGSIGAGSSHFNRRKIRCLSSPLAHCWND